MSTYITIDGGTTNTRMYLIANKTLVDSIKFDIGAKANIDDENLLKDEIENGINYLLENNNLYHTDIKCILASGMITSEFGLCNLEHIEAPAGINELHNSMKKIYLKDISDIPFVFIRGVKTSFNDYLNADVMRGEETELMGLINEEFKDCIYILPGSHSKIIKVDKTGKIIDFTTLLTGEMIAALSQQTILKDAVDLKNSKINNAYLLKGYEYCKENGINKTLFKVRILKNIFKCSSDETYSFFIGAILFDEIGIIIKSAAETVVIGGKSQIKNAMKQILCMECDKKIVCLDDNTVNLSTALGAIKIFENITI